MSSNAAHMKLALDLASKNVTEAGGGPFGAVIVRGDEVIAEAANTVISSKDPTAHAEVNAIRKASQRLGTFHLQGCELYTSCEPCPMCFGAIYWSRLDRVYFANTQSDAARAGFDDSRIYSEIPLAPEARSIPMQHLSVGNAEECFRLWKASGIRIEY